jgi:Zn-dependent alcohol dehydrogenase
MIVEMVYTCLCGSDIVKEVIKISKIGVDNTIFTATNEITLKSAIEYSRDGGVINIFGVIKKGQTIPLDYSISYSLLENNVRNI